MSPHSKSRSAETPKEENTMNDENEKVSEKMETYDSDKSDSTVGELGVGSYRRDSDGSENGVFDPDELDRPAISRMQTGNRVPASIMSHPSHGADLEKGPTGPSNMTVDDEGRIVVNCTSRSDPENPKNWPRRKKIFNVVVISSMTFLCPLCSAMFVCPLNVKGQTNG